MNTRHLWLRSALLWLLIGPRAWLAAAHPLPDVAASVRPDPEPAYPAAWDVFTPPVQGLPPPAAPAFAEYTRSAAAGDTLALTGARFSSFSGSDFGKDTRFLCYGQTTADDATRAEASIQRLSELKTAITLPDALPESLILVWPVNRHGAGVPAVINRTEAWWVGPATVTRGQSMAVYGRNLAHGQGESQSWVLLKPAGAETGRWAAVTAVNPYKVTFTVPAETTNGLYQVWAHNGHGGAYGWSVVNNLAVDDGTPWSDATHDVTAYGATGDGVTDDTAALQAALAAAGAQPWSTVVFPAGTYRVTSPLAPPNAVRWLGAGTNATFIKAGNAWTSGALISRSGLSHATFQGLTFDGDRNLPASGTVIAIASSTNVLFLQSAVVAHGYGILAPSGSTRLRLQDSTFTGNGIFLGGISQFFAQRCSFYGTDDCNVMLYQWGGSNVDISECFMADFDNSSTASGAGWSQGRWYVGAGVWGACRRTYLGHNTSRELSVRPGFWNQNTGEQFMWEGYTTRYSGIATSASPSTVSFADLTTSQSGYTAIITAGVGLGQYRTISGTDTATKTLTVSPPWTLPPEPGSRISIVSILEKTVCYRNRLDGKDSYATQNTASAGIQPFDGCIDFVASRNTLTRLRSGAISEWARTDSTLNWPVFFAHYADNVASNCYTGVRIVASWNIDDDKGCIYLGNTYRRNTFVNMTARVWDIGNGSTRPGTFDLLILDRNVCSNTPIAVSYTAGTTDAGHGTILTGNAAWRGSAAFTGSKAITFTRAQRPALRDNLWAEFEAVYSGVPPGALLEIPLRVVEASGAEYDGPSVTNLTLWNAGTSPLAWSAEDDAPWLSVSPTSGTIADETDAALLSLTCDPITLGQGVYTGTVSVTAGMQSMKAEVVFTVTSNTLFGAHWLLDEHAGDTAADASGNGNTALLRGGTLWDQGVVGSGLRFDGADSYLEVPAHPSLNPTAALSVSAWARSATANWNADACLVSKRDAYLLAPAAGTTRIGFHVHTGLGWSTAEYTPALTLTNWHHYVGTYDGTAVKLYIDGLCVTSTPCTGAVTADPGNLFIGRDDGADRFFAGSIDQVAIGTRAITPAEVAAAFNGLQNTPPVAHAQSVTTAVNVARPITLTASDADAPRDVLAFTVLTSPAYGTLTGTPPDLTYAPAPGWAGLDTFTFTVHDGRAAGTVATVSLTVSNTSPIAAAQSVGTSVNEPLAIQLSGSDPDGQPLAYAITTAPAHGTLSGTVPDLTYTPATGYAGADSLTFTVSDGFATSAAATVAITVSGATRYVSTGGSHTPPFTTWPTAATNLQAAIDAAAWPEAVRVADGTYTLTAEVLLAKGVSVRSLNGADATVLDAGFPARSIRCLRVTHASATLDGFTLRGGNASNGGGLQMSAGLARRCIVRDNRGGVGVHMTGGTLRDSAVTRNEPSGVRMSGSATVERCVIAHNTDADTSTHNHGGGVYITGGALVNCAVYGNYAEWDGGGVWQGGGVVRNCTVVRNVGRSGGGIYRSGGTVLNSVIYDNNNNVYGPDGFFYSCASSLIPNPATGNISATPLFVDPGTGVGSALHAGDYRLSAASPCIDAGSNETWMATGVDGDGRPRLRNHRVDMGAWEYGPLTCSFRADKRYGSPLRRSAFVFTAYVDGTDTTNLTYAWDFDGDGVNELDGPGLGVVTHTYPEVGVYRVTLTVRNGAGETAAFTRDAYIEIVVYYVSPVGSHQAPFTSWATAATNIPSAVDAAQPGTLVLVTNGHYRSTGIAGNDAMVNIVKDITVASVNGAEVTTLNGNFPAITNRCLYLGDPGAVLEGFTVTNGYTSSSVAGIYLQAGTAQHCIIAGNQATGHIYAKCGGIHVNAGGVLRDSLLTGNTASQQGAAIRCAGGLVERCVIRNNGKPEAVVISAGTIRNCEISQNTGSYALSVSGGTVSRCTIADNASGLQQTAGLVEHCHIRGNRSSHGAGVWLTGTGTLRNCLVYGNQGIYDGAGVRLEGAGALVESCTIVGNSGRTGDGMYCVGGTVVNTIVCHNNRASGGVDIWGTAAFTHSCSPDLPHDPAGSGNITNAPDFLSIGSGYGLTLVPGNYRLGKESPCRNGGSNRPWMTGGFDLDSISRIQPKSGRTDMGAYERQVAGTLLLCR